MEVDSYFLFLQEQIKDIIISQPVRAERLRGRRARVAARGVCERLEAPLVADFSVCLCTDLGGGGGAQQRARP